MTQGKDFPRDPSTFDLFFRAEMAKTDPTRAKASLSRLYDDDFTGKIPLLTETFDEIARIAHFGQVDKLGIDYIEHPRAVARIAEHVVPGFKDFHLSSQIQICWSALLHDVVEDTPLTIADLHKLGVPDNVLMTVNTLTHWRNVTNDVYYARILMDPVARMVKVADMMHNCDPLRLALLDEKTRERLIRKYSKGIDILTVNSFPKVRECFREVTGV